MRLFLFLILMLYLAPTMSLSAALHDAAKKGDVPALTAALESGADVNESDGWATPLWHAARRGQEEAAKLLIERGADVNLATVSSGPPLLGAIERKNGILVKLLLASGANPKAALNGKSALYLAAKGGCLECVQALVDSGAEVNALTPDREPPIHAAKLLGHHEMASYLATHGAVAPKIAPISDKLGSADPTKGQEIYVQNCARCHQIELKQGNRSGPNLWNVVGRQKASVPNVSYSETLKDWGASWSYEDLNAFLWGPKIIAPGVRMEFAGIEDEAQRANLLAYLRNQSDKPEPLP